MVSCAGPSLAPCGRVACATKPPMASTPTPRPRRSARSGSPASPTRPRPPASRRPARPAARPGLAATGHCGRTARQQPMPGWPRPLQTAAGGRSPAPRFGAEAATPCLAASASFFRSSTLRLSAASCEAGAWTGLAVGRGGAGHRRCRLAQGQAVTAWCRRAGLGHLRLLPCRLTTCVRSARAGAARPPPGPGARRRNCCCAHAPGDCASSLPAAPPSGGAGWAAAQSRACPQQIHVAAHEGIGVLAVQRDQHLIQGHALGAVALRQAR